MSDSGVPQAESNAGKWLLLVIALVYIGVSLYLIAGLHSKVKTLTKEQAASKMQLSELEKRMDSADADTETLAKQLGMTKKDLVAKASELQRQQRESEVRLAKEQMEQIGQVSGEVAGVKNDVTGVKTDVAATKSDLAATKAKLESTIGDLGLQSGLIARTRDDLETLKHKGDRNYYEFTLVKGAHPQAISTVMLQLRKADPKHGKFTLNVTSDDKTIEKKDRNIDEPIQFYSGRDHLLFELVVWTLDKKKATGYLSTPKNAPVPITVGN